ncbi:MAG: HEAT repeat domain-containing protein [Candidatus Omnitrophica bacterium]|nr:HEAT repeat domain-containing protein [Candidatus Omnitrophota bacterium]
MVNSAPKSDSGKKLFYGLFIFPLVIATGMAVLLCTVVLLTREVETPESLITAIKTGSPSKRWQKAFELSNEINQGRGMIRSSGVMKEIIHILNDRQEYDPMTRSYMAIALSRFDDPLVADALMEALTQEEDVNVTMHVIWALGMKEEKRAVDLILPYLKDERSELRKTSAYVLGVIGQAAQVAPHLLPLLNEEDRDVRWNAALSLARLGDDSGYEEILKMADRKTLSSYEGMDQAKIEEVMVSAVKGLALLKRSDSQDVLNQLATSDESLKVRQAALEAVKAFGN